MIHRKWCKKVKFDHTNKCYIHKPESALENETQNSLGFWDKNRSPNPGQKTRPSDNLKRKKELAELWTLAYWRITEWKSKKMKRDKYLDLVRELKKLWYMKVTVIPIVIGALGTVTKGLSQGPEDLEIKGIVETSQTTALLRSTWEESWRLEETYYHSNSCEKPSGNAYVKNI